MQNKSATPRLLAQETDTKDIPRLLGSYGGQVPGPLVICIGGLHGNEPAGIYAARQVLQTLRAEQLPFRGEFVALAGNRAALAQGRRYVEQDLNRLWFADRVTALRQQVQPKDANPEDEEQRDLLMSIERTLARRRGPVIFLDLHTTSAAGPPFAVIGDTLLNRQLALSFPASVILGLEEYLEGTILNYMNDCGYIAVGFEGGQNESLSSVDNHQAVIWMTLRTAGCLHHADVPQTFLLAHKAALRTRNFPRVLEVRYRHAIHSEDEFVMEPGYTNFQEVRRGQLLAHDCRGDIRAREDGYILMPLYQSQGTDGFFLVREVHPFWLKMAAWLRRLRLDAMLPWFPGIRRHTERAEALVVNPKIARWFVIELFHLLGFRRQHAEDGKLVVSRRPHDVSSFDKW